MLSDKITEVVVGVMAAIGAAVVGILKKYNLIHFGRLESESGKETANPVKCATECPAHPKVIEKLDKINDRQLRNMEILEQHRQDLKNNKDEFKSIKDSLSEIGGMVGILKDRSDRAQAVLNNK